MTITTARLNSTSRVSNSTTNNRREASASLPERIEIMDNTAEKVYYVNVTEVYKVYAINEDEAQNKVEAYLDDPETAEYVKCTDTSTEVYGI